MSLIDMSQFDRIQLTGDPPRAFLGPAPPSPPETSTADVTDAERRNARDDVDAELDRLGSESGAPAVAFRSYPGGHVVVGVSGAVDRAMARRIGTLLRDLRPHSSQGLVLTLARLGPWDPHLARVLGQARIHHLIDGGPLELHDAPVPLLAALRPDGPITALSSRGPAARRPPGYGPEPMAQTPAVVLPRRQHPGVAMGVDELSALLRRHATVRQAQGVLAAALEVPLPDAVADLERRARSAGVSIEDASAQVLEEHAQRVAGAPAAGAMDERTFALLRQHLLRGPSTEP